MPKTLEGELLAKGLKIGIVISRFNSFLTEHLLSGATDAFTRMGGNPDSLTVAWVPGSYEMPMIAKKMAAGGKFNAVVCLGCIIRGETDHYEQVVQQATRGIGEVGLETGVPTLFGVITAGSLDDAINRAGAKGGNAGAKAMASAVEMANLVKKVDGK